MMLSKKAASLPISQGLEKDLGHLNCPVVTAEMFVSLKSLKVFSVHVASRRLGEEKGHCTDNWTVETEQFLFCLQ